MKTVSIMKEVWRAVVGFEGLYEVSNWGRVKSLERVDNNNHLVKEKILKIGNRGNGYLYVVLCKDGKHKHFALHRLVAQVFIPNPDNLPIVNHKDEVTTNNFVFVREDGSVDFSKSNLEWCDSKYSINYGTRTERMAKTRTGVYNTKVSKPVYQYTLDGEFVKEWPSLAEVQRQTGWRYPCISNCCRGIRKSAYGYVWSYTKKAETV